MAEWRSTKGSSHSRLRTDPPVLQGDVRKALGAPTNTMANSSGTLRSGAPSDGAAERRQEHHALPLCVRREELRNLVVQEGESGGAEAKCVSGEVEAAADDSSLELSGPIAAIAEPGE